MTTTPAPTEIDTLKALLDSENSAPWDAEYCEPHEVWIVYDENADKVAECFDGATADLIAAARNALPALLDELAKTRAELDERGQTFKTLWREFELNSKRMEELTEAQGRLMQWAAAELGTSLIHKRIREVLGLDASVEAMAAAQAAS